MKFLAPIISCLVLAGLIIGCQSDTASMSEEVKKARIEEMYAGYNDEFPDIEAVTPAEIADAYKKNEIIIVDVREPNEQAISMIPGALTKIEFEEKRAAGTLEDKPIYMHCTIGYRSGKYAETLQARGFRVKNLAGSILMWVNAGQPVVDAKGAETRRVHVYGAQWDLLPEDYEGVY